LHQHCNAKPENWIITTNEATSNRSTTVISDLALVNFERSIDLQENTSNDDVRGDRWMDALFIGDASNAEMKCVAMRLGLPWSFDIDTFGVCTSLHFLSLGSPLEMETSQNSKGCQRWLPKHAFPRHFEEKLWKEIFDILLNFDEDFGRAIGSRPYSVKQLRQQIEDYLVMDGNIVRLHAALNHQRSLVENFHASKRKSPNAE
jgi:hypothetical protein